MNFTEMINIYKENNLKALHMFSEEATEEEFNKEIEEVKKKASGKIRNKKIDNASVQSVEINKTDEEYDNNGNIVESNFDPKKRSIYGPPPSDYLDRTGRDYDVEKNKPKLTGKEYEEKMKKLGVKILSLKKNHDISEEKIDERTLTSGEEDKKEEVVKSMKSKMSDFKKRYGDRWKNVMYATATNIAKD